MGQRENRVEHYLKQYIEARGGECLKWTSPGVAGVPDRLVILPDKVPFAVEVKTYDGEISPVQYRMHQRIMSAGMHVRVVHGRQGVDDLIGELDA